jgi:hypothetical protein
MSREGFGMSREGFGRSREGTREQAQAMTISQILVSDSGSRLSAEAGAMPVGLYNWGYSNQCVRS